MSQIKIFNDPVHGFIEVPKNFILTLIDHPYLQRLKRIRQLGLTNVVYPGANHTRFSHALGAMHLTQQALRVLMEKGVLISEEEYYATLAAILLHDIGHAPFSHALENVLIPNMHHEKMSLWLMQRLNEELNGVLALAIQIFQGQYPRPFLHQLISSQLDMDRMDFLMRDSFFTGVQEGIVGTDRIIKTLAVHNEQLVVEEKGIYSIEKFLVARRLMYWQVYLHKTALIAECMLIQILKRARYLFLQKKLSECNDKLAFFLGIQEQQALEPQQVIENFVALDDIEILYAIKQWQFCQDKVLRELAQRIWQRKLLKLSFLSKEAMAPKLRLFKEKFQNQTGYTEEETNYFVFGESVSNSAYLKQSQEPILILKKDGTLTDIIAASDLSNIDALSEPVVKYFICAPDFVWKD
ncbi:MAG: HD domain-containing protein [Bacteroidia bacterium]|nr:HD domain-containing protein [Bacteroidia bacterium]MDW8159356.1 HD domain-containing protein [Bacteroidia bacterium]